MVKPTRRETERRPRTDVSPLADRTPVLHRDVLDLLERPLNLLEISAEAFDQVVAAFADKVEPIMTAVQRSAGILAWAARHHMPDTHYGAWVHRLAELVGRSDDTIIRWRDEITSQLALPVPAVTERRSRARLAGAAKAVRQASQPRPEPVMIGDVHPTPLRQTLVALLADPDAAAVLADALSTDELRSFGRILTEAERHQRRQALHAKAAEEGQRRSRNAS